MTQGQHLHIFDHDTFLIETAGQIEIKMGDYPDSSDTNVNRYFNLGVDTAQGFDITSNQGISLIEVNNRALKVPRSLPKNGLLELQRGDWHQLKFLTTVANTTIQMDVVA